MQSIEYSKLCIYRTMSEKPYAAQQKLYKALSHPVRLWILDILAHREECVCHISTVTKKPQPYISQQLSVLREADLVVDRRDGLIVFYSLKNERISAVLEAGRAMLRANGAAVTLCPVPEGKLENCPCPHCEPTSTCC